MHTPKLSGLTIALMAAVALPGLTLAETPAAVSNAKKCIDLVRIDHTEVVDDSTILFHMKGGEIMQNKLPHRCFGLKFEDGFSYAVSLPQLCSTDIIKVFRRGTACGLGQFTPYEKPKAATEKDKSGAGATPK